MNSKYKQDVDLNYYRRGRRAPAGRSELRTFIGQLQHLFVVQLPPSKILKTREPTTLALAAIRGVKVCGISPMGFRTSKSVDYFDALEVIDIQSLDASVGRIMDRRKIVYVERYGSRAALELLPNPEDAAQPSNHRQTRN